MEWFSRETPRLWAELVDAKQRARDAQRRPQSPPPSTSPRQGQPRPQQDDEVVVSEESPDWGRTGRRMVKVWP